MSVLIGKQCTDGVFLVADSVCRYTDGSAAPDGLKFHTDTFSGEPFGVVFAGHAAIVGGRSALDYIKTVPGRAGDLQQAMGSALRSYCDYADSQPPTAEEVAAMPEHLRKEFTAPPMVVAYYSVRAFEWWITTAAPGIMPFKDIQNTHTMRGLWPTKDAQIKAALDGLCTFNPTTIAEAAPFFAAAFHRATQLLPDNCMYPGRVLIHRAAGITQGTFNDAAGLAAIAAGG